MLVGAHRSFSQQPRLRGQQQHMASHLASAPCCWHQAHKPPWHIGTDHRGVCAWRPPSCAVLALVLLC